ncbi:hypothetical protein KMP13_10545 [Epibacterium ulvae]|uniref:hypothetical protein n=1 Tax=Epibacterium ulvae TaxID=1156985 RepID=UPI001BFC43C8|nr:hypothetical protein [Epibacterium ulvae]MBT8154328.1 hypothetical protein [Epibacterium ulvae]
MNIVDPEKLISTSATGFALSVMALLLAGMELAPSELMLAPICLGLVFSLCEALRNKKEWKMWLMLPIWAFLIPAFLLISILGGMRFFGFEVLSTDQTHLSLMGNLGIITFMLSFMSLGFAKIWMAGIEDGGDDLAHWKRYLPIEVPMYLPTLILVIAICIYCFWWLG